MKHHIGYFGTALLLAACQAPASPGTPAAHAASGPGYRVLQAGAEANVVVAGAKEREALGLTVYHGDLAVVTDTRRVTLPAGAVTVRFRDVSPKLDGATAALEPPGAGWQVLERVFSADLVTPNRVLERYIGQTITLRRGGENGGAPTEVTGTLLGVEGGLVVRIGDKVHLNPPGEVIVAELPAGMAAEPTLEWRLVAPRAGAHALTARYRTSGISWRAEYTLALETGATRGRLSPWASVVNTTATRYPEASLTLVAGELNRAEPSPVPMPAMAESARGGAPDSFTQAPVSIFHRYTLDRPVTIGRDETRQLPLVPAADVAVSRELRFEASRFFTPAEAGQSEPVESRLSFVNTLGAPLPEGRVQILEGGTLVGEDRVGGTPVGETVRLRQGRVFDVVGTRVQSKVDQKSERLRSESYTVTLRNRSQAAVTVAVVERHYGDWSVTASSQRYTRPDANTLRFEVPVRAGGEATVTYTVQIRS